MCRRSHRRRVSQTSCAAAARGPRAPRRPRHGGAEHRGPGAVVAEAAGLVYGVVVSLGFATYENYTYVYQWAEIIAKEENVNFAEFSYLVALGRSYSAIPMHGLNGAVMGYYFGMYAFVSGGKNLSLALIVPYIIHGSYNFLVSFPNYYFLGVLLIAFIFSIFLYKNVRESQKLKNKEHEEKII